MAARGKVRRKYILIGLLLLATLLSAACRPAWLDILDRTIPSIIDVSFADRTEVTSDPGTVSSVAASASSGSTAIITLPAQSFSVETFDRQVRELILVGLRNRQQDIVLDSAIPARAVPEADVQAIVDRIYAIYQDIYSSTAEFFYLDGSINISYTLIKSQNSYLGTMAVKPQYWPITKDLAASQLTSLISQVNTVAEQIAGEVRRQSSLPWQQLQLVHDYLVTSIAYNSQNDQTKNQAISALLEKTTMCQGYAQAFQLIAQRLGFEVRLITGKSDNVGHAWNLVKLNGAWYHVDVTHDDPTPDGGAKQPVQHIHFLRSDARMKTTHQWVAADYPASPKDGTQYYIQSGLTVDGRSALATKIKQFLIDIEYQSARTNLLELLYTGPDLPGEAELENLVQELMNKAAAGHTVYYRQIISKQVILVEITPG